MQQVLSLYQTSLGRKGVMALSGLVLFGFTIGHMLGNLQVFAGREVMNGYAETLASMPVLLWTVRLALVVALVAHIASAVSVYQQSARARPVRYKRHDHRATSYAALTMWLSGPLILLFVVYHLAHFTWPGIAMGAYEHSGKGVGADVYANVINGFSIPWVVAIYVAAQVALGFHLYHGTWSLLQTLGINHPRYNERRRQVARALGLFVVAGNIVIPLSVLLGFVS
ncbi:MAG TPA: succinate dehydrogenase cytochrome b subunit [Polyangiaceae bacterium]|nr:succinate dehydrogenase cytochrome b subunit [Polyangiaceae bacterium]